MTVLSSVTDEQETGFHYLPPQIHPLGVLPWP